MRAPVFIVSTGRAGSQMLAHVLREHPEIYAVHEPSPQLNAEAYSSWSKAATPKRIRTRVSNSRADILKQTSANHLTYVESSHFCSHLIQPLEDLFAPKFIHLYRDCTPFIRSGKIRGWYGERDELSVSEQVKRIIRRRFLIPVGNPGPDHRLSPPKPMETLVEKHAWLWKEINEIILRDLASVPANRTFSLKLEELNESSMHSLVDFIGLPTDASLMKRMLKIAFDRPNKSKSQSPWKPNPQEVAAIENIAAPLRRRLGYSDLQTPMNS